MMIGTLLHHGFSAFRAFGIPAGYASLMWNANITTNANTVLIGFIQRNHLPDFHLTEQYHQNYTFGNFLWVSLQS